MRLPFRSATLLMPPLAIKRSLVTMMPPIAMNSIGNLRAIAATVGVEPRRLMSTCLAASAVSAAAPDGN